MSIEERLWSLKLASRAQVICAEYERTRQSRVLPYHIQGGRELAQFARRVAEQSRASFSFSRLFIPCSYPQLLCFPLPFLPFHQTKRNEYSQGYIHCIPYGKVSFVTKLSPLHPGYVITVCASPSPSSTKPTAITDNSCENMVIYTLLFCSLTIFNQMPDPNGV